jgi:putative ABC transport system ATP-binding protein
MTDEMNAEMNAGQATRTATMTTMPATAIAMAEDVTRDFRSGGSVVRALRGISLEVRPGELIALRGRSGSGKTTLLNILTGLDDPTSGRVRIDGQDLAPLGETARALLRRQYVGIMFQNAHLYPLLTAQENVEIPLRLARVRPAGERTARSRRALEMVGLMPRAEHRGMELSGGEQQRVALARALVAAPRFVVADEPTGNLDSQTGRAVALLLRDVAHSEGIGMLIATHDASIAAAADRVLQIRDGVLAEA